MSTATVKKVMQQRLTRGTPVIVADSFKEAKLRGSKMVVASKSTVKCNKGERCAGLWCAGLAVFVTTKRASKTDKEMGWRGGTTKVCLTHLKDKDGVLVLPPPMAQQTAPRTDYPSPRFADLEVTVVEEKSSSSNGDGQPSEVTWIALSHAVASGNLEQIAFMARALKSENDLLKSKVILAQDRLLAQLTG